MRKTHLPEPTASRSRFLAAKWQHSSQRRKSGEPYIIHPLAVAQILADLVPGAVHIGAFYNATSAFIICSSAAVAAEVVQCRCFDIGIAGAPANGKLFAAQEAQAHYGAVDAVLFDTDFVAGRVVGAAQMSQAQLGLWFYEPACVQVLSVAVFSADSLDEIGRAHV